MSAGPFALYAQPWYLDAVTSVPGWGWEALVLPGENGTYRAVMPVPLRRKFGAGVALDWVVHQPFFCQIGGVFGDVAPDEGATFWPALMTRYRYGSVLNVAQHPSAERSPITFAGNVATHSTQMLRLDEDYATSSARYTADRQLNLRRALRSGWNVVNSADPEPLIRLFQENHAQQIPGAVAPWAYDLLRDVVAALQQRGLARLQYALDASGQPCAGALFARFGQHWTYLFNAANPAGRRGQARTLLIDGLLRSEAGRGGTLDFESPEKPEIRQFYASFGAEDIPFYALRWNQYGPVAQAAWRAWRWMMQ